VPKRSCVAVVHGRSCVSTASVPIWPGRALCETLRALELHCWSYSAGATLWRWSYSEQLLARNMGKGQVADIVLGGGSTRIPDVQEMQEAQDFFNEKELEPEHGP